MKTVKRTVSIFLVVLMLLTAAPLAGFTDLEVFPKAQAITYQGTCGDNLTWNLDEDGTLTITGTGTMDNYTSYQNTPWYGNREKVKTVNINNGATSIGQNAFAGCNRLTTIEIPASIQVISKAAFSSCVSLKSVVIPVGVTIILDSTFWNCSSMTSITIPSSVTTIEAHAFHGCNSLSDVHYTGSEEQWNSISIGKDNSYLTTTTVYFDYINESIWVQKYVNVFSEYIDLIDNNYFRSDEHFEYDEDLYTYVTWWVQRHKHDEKRLDEDYDQWIPKLYYSFYDIDKNGIPELIIGEDNTNNSEYYIHGSGYAVYTYSNGICKRLIESGERSYFCFYSNGTIVDSGSGGAGNHGWDFCRINNSENGLETLCSIHVDSWSGWENRKCYLMNGDSIIRQISNSEADSISQQYTGVELGLSDCSSDVSLDWKLLNDLAGSNNPFNYIAVYSSEKTLSVKTGDYFYLGFALVENDEEVEEWKKMAIAISDPTILDISDHHNASGCYAYTVTGKKQGATNIIVTDTETGASKSIVIRVSDDYIRTYSYKIDSLPKFYPQNDYENEIETNIYDLNGMFVNNYRCIRNNSKFQVSFDAYNSGYHYGAVDIFDRNGNWCGSEEIDKFSNISSLSDTWDQTMYLVSDFFEGKLLTYEQASYAKHSFVSFEVPEGGYFTISNNCFTSIGTYLYNAFEVAYKGVSTALSLLLSKPDEEVTKDIFDAFFEKIKENPKVKEELLIIFKGSFKTEFNNTLKSFIDGGVKEPNKFYHSFSELTEDFLMKVDISLTNLISVELGIAESIITTFGGAAGMALKFEFAVNDMISSVLFCKNLLDALIAPSLTAYSSDDLQIVVQNQTGITVLPNGNIDPEAELQVFRIPKSDTNTVVLNEDDPARIYQDNYDLYNICFIKDDQLVQPNGKVQVRIPVPEGIKASKCYIYRQETDGSWTRLEARVEDGYLVFETDHFSFYAVIGAVSDMEISSLPDRLIYDQYDLLDFDGLKLSVNGQNVENGYLVYPTCAYETGIQTITVEYGYAQTTFDVYVRSKSSPEDETVYKQGDIIKGFGSYPQSRVEDEELIDLLNKEVGAITGDKWKSMEYYIGGEKSDFTKYCDINLNGETYRGVCFTEYRPRDTFSDVYGYQLSNGYRINTVYWFKYEPLSWKVLDPDEGILLCENVIDSQPFQNVIFKNLFSESDLRIWLNNCFYNTAFNQIEKSYIAERNVYCEDWGNNKIATDVSTNSIWLLSMEEVFNSDWGFVDRTTGSSKYRSALGTDYAKCQGLDFDQHGDGSASYWLRTGPKATGTVLSNSSLGVHCIYKNGYFAFSVNESSTCIGVRPAVQIKFLNYISLFTNGHTHTYTSTITTPATCTEPGEMTFTCVDCDDTNTETIPALGHTDENNDGHCDNCGEQMTGGDHCKFCGKIHNGGFFDKLTGFFHKIFAIFKR